MSIKGTITKLVQEVPFYVKHRGVSCLRISMAEILCNNRMDIINHGFDVGQTVRILTNNLEEPNVKIKLRHIEKIIKYSKMSYSELIKINREDNYPAYSGRLTKLQLIYQLVFLMDAPDK